MESDVIDQLDEKPQIVIQADVREKVSGIPVVLEKK